MTSEQQQLSLFSQPQSDAQFLSHQERLEMSAEQLQQWKQAVGNYQQQAKEQPAQQGTLFASSCSYTDPEEIDPFILPRSNFQFHRWPSSRNSNTPAIYFVFDYEVPLLLYVGQTLKLHQRWSGGHDCKVYVDNYLSANYQHRLQTALGTAVWWETPASSTLRLQLEAKLIAKWKPPFNKENRRHWATPFTNL